MAANRPIATSNYPGSLDIIKKSPLDTRTLLYGGPNNLMLKNTWENTDNGVFTYAGMIVSVQIGQSQDDYDIYVLKKEIQDGDWDNTGKLNEYWKKIGSGGSTVEQFKYNIELYNVILSSSNLNKDNFPGIQVGNLILNLEDKRFYAYTGVTGRYFTTVPELELSKNTIYIIIGTSTILQSEYIQNSLWRWDESNFIKLISSGSGGASGDYIPLSQKGAVNGVATLDSTKKIPVNQIPDLKLSTTII